MQNYQAKSTGNVLRWPILITSLLLSINLTGCASFSFGGKVKPIEVVTKAQERTPLDIAMPESLRLKPIEWTLVTPGNAEEVFAKLESRGENLVLFTLSDDGYQQLAITIAELRNYINTQRNIILKYKEYYEPKKDELKK
jgi:hypothetical protein